MNFTRTDVIVSICVLVGGTVLSVIVALQANVTAAILTAIGSLIIGLFVDIRLHQVQDGTRLRDMESGKHLLPLVEYYSQFAHDECPLFRWFADELFDSTTNTLQELSNDTILLGSLETTFQVLEFLFRDVTLVRHIFAASFGEWDEWRDKSSWWGTQYLELHDSAHGRGVSVRRLFVLENAEEERTIKDIIELNQEHHVAVSTVLQSDIQRSDLAFGNSLLFCDEHEKPIYSLVARHDSEGRLQDVQIHRDDRHNEKARAAHTRMKIPAKQV